MKVYEMTIADIASEIFDKGEDFAEKIFNDIDELEKNKLLEINKLKQQLAEKEKELKQLKLDLGMFKSVNAFINSYGIEKAREVLLQTEKTKHQDKISFAIDELEKVNEILTDTIIEVIQNEFDLNKLCYLEEISAKFYDKIQAKIKELKGEK